MIYIYIYIYMCYYILIHSLSMPSVAGKRTGRGTTKKLDAVTSVHHSHSNNVYAEEEDDVKPDLNTDFPVHGTSMLVMISI